MNPTRTVQVERRNGPTSRQKLTAPKPKAWNHQDDLRDKRGLPVIVRFTDGTHVEGFLAEADQFTIKLRLLGEHGQSSVTYFKGSIRSYQFAE